MNEGLLVAQAFQVAEKVSERSVFVAQPLLAVWFLQHLTKAHSQEWLCYKNRNYAVAETARR